MKRAVLVIAILLVAVSCGGAEEQPEQIVLLTHDSFAISDDVLAAFEEESGVPIEVRRAGDGGSLVNQAILTKDNPLGDVLFGVDNTFLSRALEQDLFIPYQSPAVADVNELLVDEEARATPIDFGDVCVNYDAEWFASEGVPIPSSLAELTDPLYASLLVVEDPSTSTPGLAFLLATIATFPDSTEYDWRAYWTDLVANDVAVTAGWESAYYGSFSGGTGEGDRPLVVSYASSPPAEVYFGDLPEAPTGAIANGCFRQVEYAGILRGSKNESTARLLIDFMLSRRFQEDIPLNMFVFPANETASLPDVFVQHTTLPSNPVVMAPERIEANREAWIEEWTRIIR
jgi:thiamine transport system substrate-binding protein